MGLVKVVVNAACVFLVLMSVGVDGVTWSLGDLYRLYQKVGCVNCIKDLYDDFSSLLSRKIGMESYHCVQNPIHECTCFEMLYLTKSLDPNIPYIDEKDVMSNYKKASKYYHPDMQTYQGVYPNEPFTFLQQCRAALIDEKQRQIYTEQLSERLDDCKDLQLSEQKCRGRMVSRANKKYVIDYTPSPAVDVALAEDNPCASQLLLVYLDNSGSMTGKGLEHGKNIVSSRDKTVSLKDRIIDGCSNVYMIGSKGKQVVNYKDASQGEMTLQKLDNVLQNWNGADGSTYLWEYVCLSMNTVMTGDASVNNMECEIVIVTDGMDNLSSGAFYGVRGFEEVMNRLNQSSFNDRCRLYVMCVSQECAGAVGQTYTDLAQGTHGTYCGPENTQACVELLNLPHHYRKNFGKIEFNEHIRRIRAGEGTFKMLPYVSTKMYQDYDIIKEIENAENGEHKDEL